MSTNFMGIVGIGEKLVCVQGSKWSCFAHACQRIEPQRVALVWAATKCRAVGYNARYNYEGVCDDRYGNSIMLDAWV